MKKRFSVSLCAVTLLFALTACSGGNDRLSVTTARVKTSAVSGTEYSAAIHAAESVAVIPSVSAKVSSVPVKLGQAVKAGDVLMQLDTSDAQLALKQAQAALDIANANYQKAASAGSQQAILQAKQALNAAQNEVRDAAANYSLVKTQVEQNTTIAPAQAAYDKAKADYDKAVLLLSNGAASEFDVKMAKNALDSAAAQLESAKATSQNTLNSADSRLKNAQSNLSTAQQTYNLTTDSINPETVKAAKASVDSAAVGVEVAQKRITDSTVTAPIDGKVGAVNVKVGDLAVQQSPAFQIIGNSNMEAETSVTETLIQKLKTGDPATVILAATVETLKGTVTEIAPMANPQTGMFPVKIALPVSSVLKDGMQATVRFSDSAQGNTVLVPAKSVVTREGKSVVFTVQNGKAVETTVTIGEKQGAYLSVQGLKDTDEVIVQGVNKAQNGSLLHIVSNTNG